MSENNSQEQVQINMLGLVQPVQLAFMVDVVEGATKEGQKVSFVALHLELPVGHFVLILNPDVAKELSKELRSTAITVNSGLHIAHRIPGQ